MNRAFLGGLTSLLLPFAAYGHTPRNAFVGQHRALPAAIATHFDPGPRAAPQPAGASVARSDDEVFSLRAGAAVRELLVVDGNVPDVRTLLRGLRPGVGLVEIDPALPGLPQLTAALAAHRDLAVIHVVSHAEAGVLRLGTTRVDAQALRDDRSALAAMREALRPGGDLLLYGCNAAAGREGEALLDLVAATAGIDVAASNTLTGAAALGGDWDLEIRRGDIEAPVAFDSRARRDFSGVLAAADGTFNFVGWSGANTNTLTTTDFTLSARTGGGVVATLRIGGGGAAYMNGSGGGDGNYFYLRADGANTGQFELTGVSAQEYGGTSLDNLRIVGYLPGGGQITSSVVNGTSSGGEALAFTSAELVAFQGQPIKGFKFFFDCEAGPCNPADLDFVNFSIINAEAPPLPTVTDARISIAGASGTGGAYRIGDTVTATWNNTASGDANSGIVGVTVDFSQFGGGAAVAASNSANTWTATYTIVSGAIDAINRNVSVTASNAGGGTTTADSTNATVDNIAPTVTDANISLSGATGSAGAFRIGDTVTATWNNTAGGDNNSDTISSASVNFSQFGAGAPVAASNSAGTWTASYVITSGSIEATGRNVSVTARDNAGNATTRADSSNATVDNLPPAASIVVADTLLGSGETSAVTFTFSEAVSGFSSADLTVANGTVGSVSTADGGITWTATLTPDANVTDASNAITLDNTGVVDAAGNPGSGSTNSNNYVVDTQAPTATLVVADSELLSGETSLVTVTFSEAVSGFTNSDLTVSNGTLGAVASSDGGVTWTATFTPATGVNVPSNVITLSNAGVQDAAGNPGTGTSDSNVFAIRTLALTLLVTSNADSGDDATTAASLAADIADGSGLSIREALFWVRPDDSIDFDLDGGTAGNQGGTITLGGSPLTVAYGDIVIDGDINDDGAADVTFSGNSASRVVIVNANLAAVELIGLVLTEGATASGGGGVAIGIGSTLTLRNCRITDNVDTGLGGGGVYGSSATVTLIGSTVSGNSSVTFGGGIRIVGTNGRLNLVSSTVTGNSTTGTGAHGGGIQYGVGSGGGATIINSTISGNAVTGAGAVGGGVRFTAGDAVVYNSTIVGNAASDAGGVSANGNETFVNMVVAGNTAGAGATAASGGAPLATGGVANDVAGTIESATSSFFGSAATITSNTGSLNNQGIAGLLLENLASVGTRPATHVPQPGSALINAGSTAALPADTFDVDGDSDTAETLPRDANGNLRVIGAVDIGAVESGDAIAPTVTSFVVADTQLIIGETSSVTITFSEAVSGLTLDDLTVENGSLSALASADAGITWTMTLTPDAGVTDATNVITLDNTGVTDAAGNPGVSTTASNSYAIDTLRPTASISVANAILGIGGSSLVTISFSEAVSGFDSSDLTIPNGTVSTVTSADGGITWTTTLTPTANLTDATNLITLQNAGVTDLAGNPGAGTTLSGNYAIDTQRPTASLVVADTTLSTGETSAVTITFSEAVSGFDNADLTVPNGALSAVSSADGGITWTATLTPAANTSAPGNQIVLANAGVVDAVGNSGSGTTASNAYAVQTTSASTTLLVADSSLIIGESSSVTITFSEAVSGLDAGDFTVGNGSLSAPSSVDGGVTWSATLTPAANVEAASNQLSLANSGVSTVAGGNPGTGTTVSNAYAVDTRRPTASLLVTDASLTTGESSAVTITFSEPVSGFDNADLTVPNGTLSAVASADGGVTWTATLTPAAGTTASGNVISLAMSGVSDLAGNAGAATSTSNAYAVRTGSFTVGGQVAGLSGSGLVLRNNGADDLAVAANGSFVFATPVADAATYLVSVATQPTAPDQVCTVTRGSGSVSSANVTDVQIDCVLSSNLPSAPRNISGTPGDRQITVQWQAPQFDGGSPITGYLAQAVPQGVGAKGVASCGTSGALSCVVTGLSNGTAYTLQVSASNANGAGVSASATAAVIPLGVPDAPTNVQVQVSGTQATISWVPPVNTGGAPITSYTVTATPGGQSCTVTGTPPPNSCQIAGLQPGVSYTFTVVARNAAGAGTGGAGGAPTSVVPAVIPVDSPWALGILAFCLLLLTRRQLASRPERLRGR